MNKSRNRIQMLPVSDVGEFNNTDSSDYRLSRFISSSPYREPVYVKKLKFIFSALYKYAGLRHKSFESIRVLDVACGRGGVTFPLASLSCKVTAFDIDANAVENIQRQKLLNKIDNLCVFVNDGYTFFDEHSYDVIVVSEVIEHVNEPVRFIGNLIRSMLPGSYIIVTTPNGYGPWELMNHINPLYYLRQCNWLRRLLGKPSCVKGSS